MEDHHWSVTAHELKTLNQFCRKRKARQSRSIYIYIYMYWRRMRIKKHRTCMFCWKFEPPSPTTHLYFHICYLLFISKSFEDFLYHGFLNLVQPIYKGSFQALIWSHWHWNETESECKGGRSVLFSHLGLVIWFWRPGQIIIKPRKIKLARFMTLE